MTTIQINHNYFGDEVIEFQGRIYQMEHDSRELIVALENSKDVILGYYPPMEFKEKTVVKFFPLLAHVKEAREAILEHREFMFNLEKEGKHKATESRGAEIAGKYNY
jgi:uncharacterized protein (DUF1778 family)